VQLLGSTWLQLREVEVFDQNGVNVALNKIAAQSSLYMSHTPASKAVDGEKGIAFEYSTSITDWEQGKYHLRCNTHAHLMRWSELNLFFFA
jgi:hypothetical protein